MKAVRIIYIGLLAVASSGCVKDIETPFNIPDQPAIFVDESSVTRFSMLLIGTFGHDMSDIASYGVEISDELFETDGSYRTLIPEEFDDDKFVLGVTDLKVNETYFIRAFINNGISRLYSQIITQKTPESSVASVSDVVVKQGMLSATIEDNGGREVVDCGFVWGEVNDRTNIRREKRYSAIKSVDGKSFSLPVTVMGKGLYYVMAYVEDDKNGMGYSLFPVELLCKALSIQDNDGISGGRECLVGSRLQLCAVPFPDDWTEPVTWSSSDESVASVDQTGLVTVLKEGDCVITAKVDYIMDTFRIYAHQQSVGEVLALEDDKDVYLNNVLVYAVGSRSFVVGDAENRYVNVYLGSTPAFNVKRGDIVNVVGQKITYGLVAEVTNIQDVTVLSSDNIIPEVDYKEFYEVNAKQFKEVKPVKVSGLVYQRSNSEYTFNYLYPMDNMETRYIPAYLYWPDARFANMNGQFISLKGFWLFMDDSPDWASTHNSYNNILISEAEESDSPYAVASVREVLEGTDGTYYKVTGTVSQITDTEYGRVYITDDSTQNILYLNGLVNFSGYHPKDAGGGWDSFAIRDNSIICVLGKRATDADVISLSESTLITVYNSGNQQSSLSKIIGASDGESVQTDKTLVVAKYARGILLREGSYYLQAYDSGGVDATVGDSVKVVGIKNTYAGQAQISSPAVTVISSGNVVNYPVPTLLDASNFASFNASVPTYIRYTGTLTPTDGYLNVIIDGVSGKDATISYPIMDYSDYYNKTVTVTGYYLGGTSHYITMAVSVTSP